jgi:uncharacterized protein (TIGR02147 family)
MCDAYAYCEYADSPSEGWSARRASSTIGSMWAAPDVFPFRDYREFLRAFYELNKQQGYGFSLRAFSKRAQLRSSNYLKLVMDGERNLTAPMAARFARACSLRGQAADYFCDLVAFNQADSAQERERAYARLSRFKRYRKVHKLDRAQDAYHSYWYIPVIRELAARADFEEDPQWIARKLLPPIAVREAAQALDTLLQLGLLVRAESGRLVQAEPLLATRDDGPLGHHLVTFHRSMLERAAEAIDRVPRDEREIASLTLCLSEPRLRELKQALERFRAELLQQYGEEAGARRVVQVNMQLFPLSVRED